MKLLNTLTTLSFFIFFLTFLQAQPQPDLPAGAGMVTGVITDENAQPVQYATIYLFASPDSVTVQTSITDTDGRFVIHSIPYGKYYLEIHFMGYSNHYSNTFTIDEKNSVFKLSRFKLTQKSIELAGIEVKAQKDMIQTNLDKRVYNVESSITADGATAVEILEDVPSVDVDLEGNVTLRGSENVTILVDGRPTNLTLDQIPASQIEAIEVITNPSARLEPDGMAGVLNVVLKRQKERGFNGLIGLGGALSFFDKKPYFDNYNGNLSFNYSYNKINIFLNYNYRRYGGHSMGDLTRTSWFNQDSSYLEQQNRSDYYGQRHNVRAGLDWFVNKNNTISFTFGYNYGNNRSESELISDNSKIVAGEYIPDMAFHQMGGGSGYNHNFSGNVNYQKKFNTKGMELTADLYFSQMRRNGNSFKNQYYTLPETADDYFQETNTDELSRRASAQVDFVTPVGNGGRIETGYKYSLFANGQDYALYDGRNEEHLIIDLTQSNDFNYTEHINALYFIYSNTFWEKFKIQAGLRGELSQTISVLESADTTITPKPQFNLFPTLHLRYDFSEKHSIQLSYSRRVSRPRMRQLNPFVDVSDKLNWRTGNPDLTPEFVNSVELGYLMTINKSSLNVTAFYRQRDDIISRYTEIMETTDENGDLYTYTLTSYQNLKKSQNFGFEVNFGQRIWKFWKISCNADFYRVMINSNDLIDENLSRDWAWGFRLNQTFTLPKDWDMQLNFRFRSPSITTGSMGWGDGGIGQGKRAAIYSLGLGVKKSFFKKSFVVSMNIRNLLYRKNMQTHTYSYENVNGYDAISNRQHTGFQLNLSLTYKINNFKTRVDKHSSNDEEMIDM